MTGGTAMQREPRTAAGQRMSEAIKGNGFALFTDEHVAIDEAVRDIEDAAIADYRAGVERLRELSDAATPGPWKGCAHVNGTDPDCPCRYEGDIWDGSEERVVAFLGDCGCKHTDEDCRHLMVRTVAAEDREQGYANGRLIVAAVNHVRSLLSDESEGR